MTTANAFQSALAAVGVPKWQDEVLQELWDIKAKINEDAGYDLRRLVENANRNTAQWVGADGRVRADAGTFPTEGRA
jgi:hypothetical protein